MFQWFLNQPWSGPLILVLFIVTVGVVVHYIDPDWLDGNWDDVE